jgi:hypothetical protein
MGAFRGFDLASFRSSSPVRSNEVVTHTRLMTSLPQYSLDTRSFVPNVA